MFSKNQIEFMKSIGLDYEFNNLSDRELEIIEDSVSQKLQDSGFDEDYKITDIGKMCESILDELP